MFTSVFIIYLMAIKMVRGQFIVSTRSNEFSPKNTMVDFSYHNHEAVSKLLSDVSQMYPHLCQLYSVGKSAQGWSLTLK